MTIARSHCYLVTVSTVVCSTHLYAQCSV